jgi:hypothetical protein
MVVMMTPPRNALSAGTFVNLGLDRLFLDRALLADRFFVVDLLGPLGLQDPAAADLVARIREVGALRQWKG